MMTTYHITCVFSYLLCYKKEHFVNVEGLLSIVENIKIYRND